MGNAGFSTARGTQYLSLLSTFDDIGEVVPVLIERRSHSGPELGNCCETLYNRHFAVALGQEPLVRVLQKGLHKVDRIVNVLRKGFLGILDVREERLVEIERVREGDAREELVKGCLFRRKHFSVFGDEQVERFGVHHELVA